MTTTRSHCPPCQCLHSRIASLLLFLSMLWSSRLPRQSQGFPRMWLTMLCLIPTVLFVVSWCWYSSGLGPVHFPLFSQPWCGKSFKANAGLMQIFFARQSPPSPAMFGHWSCQFVQVRHCICVAVVRTCMRTLVNTRNKEHGRFQGRLAVGFHEICVLIVIVIVMTRAV